MNDVAEGRSVNDHVHVADGRKSRKGVFRCT
jgi:hypothetical protein